MTQQVRTQKASNLRGKEKTFGMLIALLAVALALVVILQGARPTALSTTNLAPPASDFPTAGRAAAFSSGAELGNPRGVAAIRARDIATGSRGVPSAARLRNVAAVRVADAAGTGAGTAAVYARLRGVAGVRALDGTNSQAGASTTAH